MTENEHVEIEIPKKDSEVESPIIKNQAPSAPSQEQVINDQFNERLKDFDNIIKFRDFIGICREPEVTDTEIVICFADIRGFTRFCRDLQEDYQDRKIQNFLKTYFKIFNQGLVKWFFDWTDERNPTYDKDVHNEIRAIVPYIAPTMYKGLGDGMMLVWEIPPDLSFKEQGYLAKNIYFLINNIEQLFYLHFRNLSGLQADTYSRAVNSLDIGFGAAKGHAWKMNFGSSVDYAGSIINLSYRLQDIARPRGVVATYDLSPSTFDGYEKENAGQIKTIKEVRNYSGKVKVFITKEVDDNQEYFEKATL